MLTLYTFGPAFGLPDASPFVTKMLVLMKMSGLQFTTEADFNPNGPKGKRPYLRDGDEVIADSTFIRRHLEQRHGVDFCPGLSAAQNASGWAFEKMCEDHLYWAVMDARWLVPANFAKGPSLYFNGAPAPLRPFIRSMVVRNVRKRGIGHGMGRHSRSDIESLAQRDLQALSDFLGDRPYFFGDRPCGWDATLYAFILGALCPHFDTPIRTYGETLANLVAYRDRMSGEFFP